MGVSNACQCNSTCSLWLSRWDSNKSWRSIVTGKSAICFLHDRLQHYKLIPSKRNNHFHFEPQPTSRCSNNGLVATRLRSCKDDFQMHKYLRLHFNYTRLLLDEPDRWVFNNCGPRPKIASGWRHSLIQANFFEDAKVSGQASRTNLDPNRLLCHGACWPNQIWFLHTNDFTLRKRTAFPRELCKLKSNIIHPESNQAWFPHLDSNWFA